MTQRIDLDSEAARLLKEADWLWSDAELAFVEARDRQRETTEEYHGRSKACVTHTAPGSWVHQPGVP